MNRSNLFQLLQICIGMVLSGFLAWWASNRAIPIRAKVCTYGVYVVVWWVLTGPAGTLIGAYLKEKQPADYVDKGLEEAGRQIGQLERTIVLVFYLAGSIEGIAFLVVAKSIYRFGDLRKGHEMDETSPDDGTDEVTFSISEYIILGSLMSYTVAMFGGIYIDLLFDVVSV